MPLSEPIHLTATGRRNYGGGWPEAKQSLGRLALDTRRSAVQAGRSATGSSDIDD